MQLGIYFLTLALANTLGVADALPTIDQGFSRVASAFSRSGHSTRSTQDSGCADPTLAQTVHQAYSSQATGHIMNFHYAFVHADTTQGTTQTPFWSLQGPIFNAWKTQQPFTFPLFTFTSASTGGTNFDFMFLVGQDAHTPPVVSGFSTNTTANLVAWVYNTPICGSVPLKSAAFAPQTDHYYTTDVNEHASLLSNGWTDSGIVAYVLPLPSP